MNVNRLELMVTMLKEVEAGTWKASPTRLKEIFEDGMYNQSIFKEEKDTLKDFAKSPKEFDLQTWYNVNPHNENNEETCGFSACAVGHAMLDPRFNRMGLKSAYIGWFNTLKPIHGDNIEFDAVKSFFELTSKVAESLFMPTVYPPHLVNKALVVQVRRRIEKLLELGETAFSKTKLCDDDVNTDMLVGPTGRIYKEYKEYKNA